MIYVTHDQVEAMTMGDRICVMRDGLIMQVADPLTLYRQPENLFVAGFIGSPPMNLLKGKVQRRDGGLFFVEVGEKTLSWRAINSNDRSQESDSLHFRRHRVHPIQADKRFLFQER
jgi:ABC-type sugar transport system ATPase subunit